MLYAVRVGDTAHYAVFKTDGAAKFNEYKKTVNQFLASMKFTETRSSKPRPTEKTGQRPPAVRRPGQAPQVLETEPQRLQRRPFVRRVLLDDPPSGHRRGFRRREDGRKSRIPVPISPSRVCWPGCTSFR